MRRHYANVREQVRLLEAEPILAVREQPIVVPVAGWNRVTARTLAYAKSISGNVAAVFVTDDLDEAERLKKDWDESGTDVPLVILESPYRALVTPLLAYIEALHTQDPDAPITVVLPEYVPRHWWEFLLHNQNALRLKLALFFRPNTIVIDMPYHLRR